MELTPEKTLRPEASDTVRQSSQRSPQQPRRLKKPPPITPRRFTRFFTPRLKPTQRAVRTSRAALRDISGAALNARRKGTLYLDPSTSSDPPRFSKKRKLSFNSAISSIPSSPIKQNDNTTGNEDQSLADHLYGEPVLEDSDLETLGGVSDDEKDALPLTRTTRYRNLSTSANTLYSRLSGRRTLKERNDSHLWLDETAGFYSSHDDININSSLPTGLPFSLASCNTNPLVAVGDEEGNIRLIDSANNAPDLFSKTFLSMKPHENAIMDLEFSEDDSLLATGSGDQTCQIIDMRTQRPLYRLTGHNSSIKRVQFQPGSGHYVLASCGRDGCVNFWDLRSNVGSRPTAVLQNLPSATSEEPVTVSPKNTVRNAHGLHPNLALSISRSSNDKRANPVPGRKEFSVTSLAFISASRSHLLATASEVDSVVNIWDIRTTSTGRRGVSIPVSRTQEPCRHERHRHFGMTSIAMSTDGARMYTLCRDHTVYAYSTSHLIIGDSPEMSMKPSRPFRPGDTARQGLGPLYGFRHPALRVTTFYPKLALRQSSDDNNEMLAAASTDDCAVLFPTNERYLIEANKHQPDTHVKSFFARPGIHRSNTEIINSKMTRPEADDTPIYYHGTPLVQGHCKEVTGVTWTTEGNLITTSDDFDTRCWRQDRDKACLLRTKTYRDAETYRCGWAYIGHKGFDKDDDDDDDN